MREVKIKVSTNHARFAGRKSQPSRTHPKAARQLTPPDEQKPHLEEERKEAKERKMKNKVQTWLVDLEI